ncbi:MAG: PTS transporter subunit IIC [Clostridia bacterium]|nr:PTS transporter subunit IIC [Clostridia bacterium]
MDWLATGFLSFFNKFLGQAPLLLGTVVFIGYLMLKEKWYKALAGFIKTYVGFKILQIGTSGLVGVFRPIIDLLASKYGITALVIDPYYGQTSATEFLDSVDSLAFVGYVMMIAFAFNIFLVALRKFTKIRTLFITGHIMYMQSAVMLWALYWVIEGTGGDAVSAPLLITTGLLVGTYWSVMSNLIVEPTQDVTNGEGFSVGHQQMLGIWLAYKIAGKVGNKSHDVNEIKAPGFLSILNDSVVANALIMTVFVGTIMLLLGKENFAYDSDNYYFATYVWETCAYFAVYITILLMGVKMFVAELTQSFKGISDKILKGSVPAVDCVVTFSYSIQAPIYGFIFGLIGQLIAIFTLILLKSPVLILSGFICLFIDNGTLAVYANKAGGRKAAAIIPFFAGLIQVFGSAWVLTYLVGPKQIIGWMGMFDWATLWAGTMVLSSYLGIIVPLVLIPLLLIIPQLQYRKNKDAYFTTMRYQTNNNLSNNK